MSLMQFRFDKASRQRLLLIAAFICFLLAAVEVISPGDPPRRALQRAIYDNFGVYGYVAQFIALGSFCIAIWIKNRQ